MSNYIAIHKPSQLIKNIVTTSLPPTPDGDHAFYAASEIVLTKYYKLKSKANRNGTLVSVGDLAAASQSFLESLQR